MAGSSHDRGILFLEIAVVQTSFIGIYVPEAILNLPNPYLRSTTLLLDNIPLYNIYSLHHTSKMINLYILYQQLTYRENQKILMTHKQY